MNNKAKNERLFRSPHLMNPPDTALLVIDVQEKLLPHISEHPALTWNISRLLRAASALNVKTCVTEQYPRGLGHTVPDLTEHFVNLVTDTIPEKLMFSCRECAAMFDKLDGIRRILVCGIETHVCVLQTVLDLLASGFEVYVCADAVGSRFQSDKEVALRRMESSGATLVTTEMAMFELCEIAGTPEFKVISKLAQESMPS